MVLWKNRDPIAATIGFAEKRLGRANWAMTGRGVMQSDQDGNGNEWRGERFITKPARYIRKWVLLPLSATSVLCVSRVLIVGMVQSLPYSVESTLSDIEKGAAFSDLNLMPMPEVLS